ncbi:hypothetical protein VNI00_013154 [Paramarasmius palmivorus]|uniref:F-box domain-containing protein n=1 Tax=Paramarasmius palmivorus TaxID=297713 RepID=A0AAW0BYM2_9AGAR
MSVELPPKFTTLPKKDGYPSCIDEWYACEITEPKEDDKDQVATANIIPPTKPIELSPELMLKIFFELYDNVEPTESVVEVMRLLTSVCHYWREVALSSTAFWSRIVVCNPLKGHVNMVREWLRRSGSRPLTIDFTHYSCDEATQKRSTRILKTLLKHVHRWYNVKFELSNFEAEHLGWPSSEDEAPLLRHFALIHEEDLSSDFSTTLWTSVCSTGLETIQAYGCKLNRHMYRLDEDQFGEVGYLLGDDIEIMDRLQELQVEAYTTARFLYFVRSCAMLQRLVLHHIEDVDGPIFSILPNPRPLQPFPLSHLVELKIEGTSEAMEKIARYLVCPALRYFTFAGEGLDVEVVLRFLEDSNCQLHSFDIEFDAPTPGALGALMDAFGSNLSQVELMVLRMTILDEPFIRPANRGVRVMPRLVALACLVSGNEVDTAGELKSVVLDHIRSPRLRDLDLGTIGVCHRPLTRLVQRSGCRLQKLTIPLPLLRPATILKLATLPELRDIVHLQVTVSDAGPLLSTMQLNSIFPQLTRFMLLYDTADADDLAQLFASRHETMEFTRIHRIPWIEFH